MKVVITMSKCLRRICIAVCLSTLLTSCSGRPGRVPQPKIVPDDAGASAITTYDTDGDQTLSPEELRSCPGLKTSVARFDKNGDGNVTAEEIAARLRILQERRIGMMSVSCRVELDGRPLSGATVRFVPEPFLGEAIASASGVTDRYGMAAMGIAPSDLPQDLDGLTATQPGIYKVEVTHPTLKLPTKYNSNTELGLEVAQDNPELVNLAFLLKSR